MALGAQSIQICSRAARAWGLSGLEFEMAHRAFHKSWGYHAGVCSALPRGAPNMLGDARYHSQRPKVIQGQPENSFII